MQSFVGASSRFGTGNIYNEILPEPEPLGRLVPNHDTVDIELMEKALSEKILRTIPNKHLISSVRIPASVESIGERCFCHCKSLSEVTFSDGSQLKNIDNKAFYQAKITEICIPGSAEKYQWELLFSVSLFPKLLSVMDLI